VPIASTPLVERIARVLAGRRLSANADGPVISAASDVDIEWQDDIEDAIAVLKALREPDEAMASVGDVDTWQHMISAAIEQAATIHDAAG
jgi:hypothetical protein